MKQAFGIFSFFIFILLLSCTSTESGILYDKNPATEEEMNMQIIQEFQNDNEDSLYIKINSWFVDSFGSAESVIEFSDKENHVVMGNFLFDMNEGISNYSIKSTIKIEIKQAKIKIVFSNPKINRVGDALNGRYPKSQAIKVNQTSIKIINTKWKSITENLIEYINKANTTW